MHNINKMLTEIQNDRTILELLSSAKIPSSPDGQDIVRAACNLLPQDQITQAHVVRAILSGILSSWRQYYFGSCHTTAPLIMVKKTTTYAVIKDLQEIILHGSLSRRVNGEQTNFPAAFTLYNSLQEKLSLEFSTDQTTRKTNYQRLRSDLSLQLAWKLLQPLQPMTLEMFLSNFIQKRAEDSFTLQDLVVAMKPKEMEQKEFERILKYLESRHQNPLLQTWQNGVMSMHCNPLNWQDYGGEIFTTTFIDSLKLCSEELHLPDIDWDNIKLHPTKEQIQALSSFRFSLSPPLATEDSACANLCLACDDGSWKFITSQGEFSSALADLLGKIIGKKIALNPQITKKVMDTFWKKMALETPWRFSIEKSGYRHGLASSLYTTYFHPTQPILTRNIFSSGNINQAMCDYRNWAKRILARPGKKLRSPAVTLEHAETFSHICTAIANEQMTSGPFDSPKDWEQAFRVSLERLPLCENLPKEEIESILRSALSNLPTSPHIPSVNSLLLLLSPKEHEKFCDWFARLEETMKCTIETELKRIHKEFARTHEKYEQDPHHIEWLKEQAQRDQLWGLQTLKTLIKLDPKIRKETVFKFADTNWVEYDSTTGKLEYSYYAFALTPTLMGQPEWQTVQIGGNSMSPIKFKYFDLLQHPELLIESLPEQSYLPAKKIVQQLAKYADTFTTCWNTQHDPNNSIDQRPKLSEIKARYQKAIDKLRKMHNLKREDELFVTMYNSSDTPEAIEALLADDNKMIDKSAPQGVLMKKI
jgi:hypothetical protein